MAIRYVDRVILLGFLAGYDEYNLLVKYVKPNVVAVTAGDPRIDNKTLQAKNVDAEIHVVDYIEPFSSTKIIKPCCIKREYIGIVQEGFQQARDFGFPTANIYIEDHLPNPGVYDCMVWLKDTIYKGICYYDNRRPNILETHLFNNKDNFYGEEIRILLGCFVRSPLNIACEEKLREVIDQDVLHILNNSSRLS